MRRKLFVFLVLALALLLARPPASLFDAALAHFTGDGLRLLQAEGGLWNGHGVLASRSPDGRSVAPWLPLAWRFDSAALTRGALRWVFTGSGKPLATLEAGAGGLSVDGLGLFTPADAALASIPHPVARAGWQGDLSIEAPHWQCPPDGLCTGEARILWRGASSALFPGRRFGDYEAKLSATRGQIHFAIRTLDGEVRLDGQGDAEPRRMPRFDGSISGDPDFLARLPAIAGGAAKATAQPGRFEIHWPPR